VGEDLVPPPPRFREGLPGAERGEVGTFLPRPLDFATDDLIWYCTEKYPVVVSEAVAAAREAEARTWEARLRVERAQWLAGLAEDRVQLASRWGSSQGSK